MISNDLASATCIPTFEVGFSVITEPCPPSRLLKGRTAVGYIPKCQCSMYGVM